MLLKQCNSYWGAVTWRSITKCRSHSQHWHRHYLWSDPEPSGSPVSQEYKVTFQQSTLRVPTQICRKGSPPQKPVFPKLSSLQLKPVLVFCQLKGVDIIIWCNQETYPVHRHFKRHQQYFPTCVKMKNTKRLKSLWNATNGLHCRNTRLKVTSCFQNWKIHKELINSYCFHKDFPKKDLETFITRNN